MIQEIIAALIVLFTFFYVFWRVYKIFINKNKSKNPGCNACPSANACQLKELKFAMEKKKEGCSEPDRL